MIELPLKHFFCMAVALVNLEFFKDRTICQVITIIADRPNKRKPGRYEIVFNRCLTKTRG